MTAPWTAEELAAVQEPLKLLKKARLNQGYRVAKRRRGMPTQAESFHPAPRSAYG